MTESFVQLKNSGAHTRGLFAVALCATVSSSIGCIREPQDPAPAAHASTNIATLPSSSRSFAIDCSAAGHPINPRIYGIAFSARTHRQDTHEWELEATAVRWGGNPKERFNWKIGNAWNTGSDWYFRNLNYVGDDQWTWRDFLEENRRRGVQTALTVPLIGWVAKDTSSYSFPVAQLGAQERVDPHKTDAGNGKRNGGMLLPSPPPSRTSVPAEPAFVGEWVSAIRAIDAERGGRSVHTYILGNEPMIWSTTHRDVHPDPVGYDELLDRTLRYGTAVRRADPQARIAGPALWGWTAYFYSGKDQAAGFRLKPDRRAHGDVPFVDWYLRKLKAHEQETGVKILDALDVHFYPQGNVDNDRTDPKTAAQRIRSTRGLWDPTYVDESWIGEPVRLIPRMQEIIRENYPGLDFIIGEYRFGAEHHMSGALALAEVLGRFGTGGVDEAYYWTYPKAGSLAFWAFRAYRNYDGAGARFLDVSLPTRAPEGASLFASRNRERDRLVAVALNFNPNKAVDAKLDLSGCAAPAAVRAFTLTEGATSLAASTAALAGGSVRARLSPYSITVFEVTLHRGARAPLRQGAAGSSQ